ncbi:Hypothetical protein GLP15_4595 [Giardia lamblia P15]|uniref:MYND-type domain-containing protein n=1 Tax=Giardia intestinalis (strain P15) TaxID=658858 RepID=E1F128_GIAIA|nr:Hypothetical protein GLP15_4595 [Giardia lamblia P15]
MRVSASASPRCCECCLQQAPKAMRCAACRSSVYCSPGCQALDWAAHRHLCGLDRTVPSDLCTVFMNEVSVLPSSLSQTFFLLIRKILTHILITQSTPDSLCVRSHLSIEDIQKSTPALLDVIRASIKTISLSVFIRIQQKVYPKFTWLLPLVPYAHVLGLLDRCEARHVQYSCLGLCFNSVNVPPIRYSLSLSSSNSFIQNSPTNVTLKENKPEVLPPCLPSFFELGTRALEPSLRDILTQFSPDINLLSHLFLLPTCALVNKACTSHAVLKDGCLVCEAGTCITWKAPNPNLFQILQAYAERVHDALLCLNEVEARILKDPQTCARTRLTQQLTEILVDLTLVYDGTSTILPFYRDAAPILHLKHAYLALMQSTKICNHCFGGSVVAQVETILSHSPFTEIGLVDLVLSLLRTWVRLETQHSYNVVMAMFEPICLCNTYLIQKLERMAPPPIRRSASENPSNDVLQRLKQAADALVPQHIKLLGVIEEVYEFANILQLRAKEGPLIVAYDCLEKLIGQVEARLEDIESWTDTDQAEGPDFEVRGIPVT